ncbi:MAG TPA: ATP-binding cassette domain-containing protein, partial [Aliiroseovarius sp.]|nr:ATP-binding cassette domain-containing protein [Aliiroseovarius sp.]
MNDVVSTGTGRDELRAARSQSKGLFWAAALFSVFVNLLMLTGPLFMLQIYDRVLGSRSEETLLALFILMAFLFATMGVLDYLRGRILTRFGLAIQARLEGRVFAAIMTKAALAANPNKVANAMRDLDAVQRFTASPVFTAVFDIAWTPVFLAGILVFHPWLGVLALVGGGLLIALTILNQIVTKTPAQQAYQATAQADRLSGQLKAEAEMVTALGLREAGFERWLAHRQDAAKHTLLYSDRAGWFTTAIKAFRMFLQSAMLGLAAYLVLQNQVTAGAMIASSILMGRALAPVELMVGQWSVLQQARQGWRNLATLLDTTHVPPPRMALPRPKAVLTAEKLTLVAPGQSRAALKMISFKVEPGQAMGVIGPSGAGKSTLARALTGVWKPAGGTLRLDGVALDQYDPAVLGRYVGYLPQRVQLFDGTIRENIAGLATNPDDAAVAKAARTADAHQMILRLPDGYDTPVSTGGGL